MRHPPTNLYIDTQVFVSNNLKLDTPHFRSLKQTFLKGGLRLLVPEMMERELMRKYKERAKEAANSYEKAIKKHPVGSLELGDMPSRTDLELQCLAKLQQQWEEFKEHFIVEMLPLVGSLEEVVDWYIAVKPPFASGGKRKEFPDAFIMSVLDKYHQQHNASIAVVTEDQGFNEACQPRPYLSYYSELAEYIKVFEPEFTPDTSKIEPIDLSSPVVTEDITVLKEILGRGDSVTSVEVDRAMMLLKTHGTNYSYFFLNCSDPLWLDRLKNDYFKKPPNKIVLPDNTVQYPAWPELLYLKKIRQELPDEVIDIVLKLPQIDNLRIYDNILEIALSLGGNQSVRLKPMILEYASLSHYLIPHRFAELLAHWTTEDQLQAALDLADVLIHFHPDPLADEKHKRKAENNQDDAIVSMDPMLEPAPRFDDWNYRQIMDEGVRPLALKEPYEVARLLIDATANMIRLRTHLDEFDKGSSHDSSEIWCPKLEEQRRDNAESKETLVNTLTYTCKEVFAQLSRETVASLERIFRNQRWQVFERIRQHLYVLYPNDQTKPWILELILGYNDYAKGSRYPYEFQRMIRTACEHFGVVLLTEEERTRIFDLILSGPERLGDQSSEADFEQWSRAFHRLQLRPFVSLLFGKYADYYQTLASDDVSEDITDDTYLSFRVSTGGFLTYRSPKSVDELSTFSDEALLKYINDWQNEHSDQDDWLIKVNIPALANAFQSVFTESIITDDNRLSFWVEQNRDQINRPIYVEYMIRAIQAQVEAGNCEQINRWFNFCKWILTHPDEDSEAPIRYHDRFREDLSWRSSIRAVGDFVKVCLKEETNIPISARGELASLLEALCTQFDWGLDREESILLTPDDPLTDAINTTRGRALESLIDFGIWVRSYNKKADVDEITSILEQRFDHKAAFPLTMPEYALLGRYYPHFYQLFKQWAVDHKSVFFPQDNIPVWLVGFGSLLIWNHPSKSMFEIIRDDFEFALKHIDEFKQQNQSGRELPDVLGEHLFFYYAWDVVSLEDDSSLLGHFYQTFNCERQRWATLFDFVGRSLRSTTKQQPDEALNNRVAAFFEWRLEASEPQELRKFTFWLEAECLDAEWRLDAYSSILDVPDVLNMAFGGSQYASLHIISLHKMIPVHTKQVLSCFEKLLLAMPAENLDYIPLVETKSILKAGLSHEDQSVRKTVERIREALLRRGQLGYTDMDD